MEGNTVYKIRSGALGRDPQRPTPIGTTTKADTERGYGVEIAVMEVVRGREAEERIQIQGVAGSPPPVGFERILVRIRFTYFRKARGMPDAGNEYRITANNFESASVDGTTKYELPILTRQPEPELIGASIAPGETREGWIVLQVPSVEKQPLLSFHRESAPSNYVLIHTWQPIWFKLFAFDPMQLEGPCGECRV
jgi:hypothetical protein